MPGWVLPAVGLGISALTNIFGARRQARAAEDAARLQAESAQRAMGLMNQAYAPYLNLGGNAATVLGRLMTPGVPYTPEMQAFDAQGPMTPPPWMATGMTAVPRPSVMGPVLSTPSRRRR